MRRVQPRPGHRPSRRAASGGLAVVGLLTVGVVLSGCSDGRTRPVSSSDGKTVTVTNCGENVTFPRSAGLYVNGPNKVAMTLAIGAGDQLVAVSGIGGAEDTLSTVYGGDVVADLPVVSEGYPTFENVIARQPEVFVGGWSSGYDEKKNLTPAGLAEHDIAAYTASYTCRQGSDDALGIMPPWEALFTDLTNLGKITGNQDQAQDVVADIKQRLEDLRSAPQADEPPTVFLFDSGTKDILSSGSYGAPQAIIEAAGGRNALE